jgi:drug/metabolite transporter (DMT)-like permease
MIRGIPDRAVGVAALAGAATLWGVTFTLTVPALDPLSASQVAVARLVTSLPLLAFLNARSADPSLPPLRLALPFALTGLVGYFMFTNLGLERVSAGSGALVQGSTPALTALLAVAVLREPLTRRTAASVALAVAGAAVMATASSHGGSLLGLAFIACACCCWSLYIVLGRAFTGRISPEQRSFLPAVIASVLLAPVAFADGWTNPGAETWLLIAGLGLVGGGVGYPLWNAGVSRVRASTAGIFANVSPIVAVIISWAALGDGLDPLQLAGGAVVLAGALLASLPQRERVAAAGYS